MYWLKALIEERGINSLYFLSKETGIAESTFSTMIKNDTDYKDVKFGNMLLIAKAAEYELDEFDEFVEWLEDFTKINEAEKNRLS
ncbi:TPA: helix-turn-helix domain-containing protein [Listeria monocytogenes]|nr:helix-turn-helix domain-containing protein [Listeria monocytogenes]HDT9511370.1 helix-turn-helix domain-containing protein [Listeria monocytogenes]HDU0864228.1 helix-turn-helix domain-containing protein [Listeria monocytogenes]